MEIIKLLRIALGIGGIFAALFAPPWVPLLIIGALAFRFPAWEALVLGFLMDALWMPAGFFASVPYFTIAAFILVWGLEPLRRELLLR